MVKNIQSTVTLHNGVEMPWFGLGVYKVTDESEIVDVVAAALNYGYRHIDTASFYQNEEESAKEFENQRYHGKTFLSLQRSGMMNRATTKHLKPLKTV